MRTALTAIGRAIDYSRISAVVMWAILLVTASGSWADAPHRQLVVTVKGDQVQYGYGTPPWGEIQGDVRIHLEIVGEPDSRVTIRADRTAFHSGQIEAQKGITVATPQGVLTGEYLEFNLDTGKFCLKQARSIANLNAGADEAAAVYGYAFGEEIGREHEVVYIVEGKITTCDRARPHYALQAKRIEYHPAQQRFKVKGAAVHLYDVRIPLIPSFSFRVGPGEQETTGILPVPGYSSRDKLYLPYRFQFNSPNSPWRNDLRLWVTQKRGIRVLSANEFTQGRWQTAGYFAETEDTYDDLGNALTLDRRPELTITRFATSPDQKDGWSSSLSLGNIVEESRHNSTTRQAKVREQRAAVTLRYDRHGDQRHRGQGRWYSLSGRQAFYSTGDDYHDLAFSLGGGGSLGNDLAGSLTLTQHLTGGRTPFMFDRVNIETELEPSLEAQLSRRWAVSARGWYDLDESKLRDYKLGVSRRSHCLTWSLEYRFVGERVGLRVDINGLTGSTAPYTQQSDLDRLFHQAQSELAASPEGE